MFVVVYHSGFVTFETIVEYNDNDGLDAVLEQRQAQLHQKHLKK